MAEIALHNRAGEVIAHALVDGEDWAWLDQWPWHLDRRPQGGGYVSRNILLPDGRRRPLRMHRFILGLDFGDAREGDHINRNRLDHRRQNLRIVPDRGANLQNVPAKGGSSIYRGVTWDKGKGKWAAQVQLNSTVHHLGRFDTEEEAAQVAATFRREHMPFAIETT